MTLLQEIERHLKRTGTPPTTFGRRALNDPNFVRDLREGRVPGKLTVARARLCLRRPAPGAAQ